MSNKFLRVGFFLLCLQFVIFALYKNFRADSGGVKIDSIALLLDPAIVQLGGLKLSERREVTVNLVNKGAAINGLRLEADCGCIKAEISKSALLTGEKAELKFTIVAPSIPQKFSRMIRLRGSGAAKSGWLLPILGEASAQIWSIPSEVDLRTDDQGVAKGRLAIHGHVLLSIDHVESNSDDIKVKVIETEGENSKIIEYAVLSKVDGQGTIHVSCQDESSIPLELAVPIAWRVSKLVACSPKVLYLAKTAVGTNATQHNVLIFLHDSLAGVEPQLETLVPWIKVSALEKLNIGKWQAKLQLEPSVPESFSGEVLRILVPGLQSQLHNILVSAQKN